MFCARPMGHCLNVSLAFPSQIARSLGNSMPVYERIVFLTIREYTLRLFSIALSIRFL